MKVLSLMEPWATLIRAGQKRVETRSWKTAYRGELYIHASAKRVKRGDAHIEALLALIPDVPLGYGHILCRCKLTDCVRMDERFLSAMRTNEREWLCGEYAPGRYAWLLEDVEPLDAPVPAKGHLGLWTL